MKLQPFFSGQKQNSTRSFFKLPSFVSPYFTYRVEGESMFPAIQPKSLLVVSKFTYVVKKPKVGDIVVVKRSNDRSKIVKRIAKIYDSTYYILGDNQKKSTDSRHFGVVALSEIVGKVVYVFSPDQN